MKIFVEGINDERFISAYLKHLKISMDEERFIRTGGWQGIGRQEYQIEMEEEKSDGGTNLIIFDADDEPDKRCGEILSLVGDGLVNSSDIFLFPDNQHEGDIETLLENIIVEENKFVFNCWSRFMDCLGNNDKGQKLHLPDRKAKIFDYVSLLGSKAQEKDRNYMDSSLWNLDASYLEPLRDFLVSALDSSQIS